MRSHLDSDSILNGLATHTAKLSRDNELALTQAAERIFHLHLAQPHQPKHQTIQNMSTKTPECWASAPQARGLRIEATPDRSLLPSHNHFIFAELDSGGDEQNLKLVFTTHEISVRGHHLRRIETILQRMELSLLAKLPSNQRKLITQGQPVILEIVVTEAVREY